MKETIRRIAEYQKLMGYDFDNMPLEQRMQMLRNYATALLVEQGELINEMPWKPWRPIEDQKEPAYTKAAEEWVDCFFFLVDQALVLWLTPEVIEETFERVLKKNLNRLSSGYSNTKGGL